MKMLLMGPPGAGKGTQAGILSEELNVPHISTGEMLREAIDQGTELGKLAKSLIDDGNFVPDDVIIGIVRERLERADCSEGYLLDGFPRTIPQAEVLDNFAAPDVCLALESDEELIVKRLVGRRNCIGCHLDYNVAFHPPRVAETCDECGKPLNRRADDNEEAIRTRLAVYETQTRPLLDYYGQKGNLVMIDGSGRPEKVMTRLRPVLDELKKKF
jgi:adenylate kinase